MELDHEKKEHFKVCNGVLVKYTGKDTNVVIPEGVREIAATAFRGRYDIISVCIPNSVESIGQYAFVNCNSLRKVDIGFGIRSIPMGCFMGLSSLETVTITDRLDSIERFAFRGCKSLVDLFFLSLKERDPITLIEKENAIEDIFSGKPYKISFIAEAESIPEIDRIGDYAFAGCDQFNGFAIKENTRYIGIGAFDKSRDDVYYKELESELRIDRSISNVSGEHDQIYDFTDYMYSNENCPVLAYSDNVQTSESEQIISKDEFLYHEELWLDGFSIDKDLILNNDTGESVKDAPITVLNLGTRAYTCLNRVRNNFVNPDQAEIMVTDLLRLGLESMATIRNMGVKTLEEIVEKIHIFLAGGVHGVGFDLSKEEETIAPRYFVVDGIITEQETRRQVADIGINRLELSVRVTNSLHRGGVSRLSELITLTEQQLFGFPNMGSKSVAEIIQIVPAYLDANQKDPFKPVEPDGDYDERPFHDIRLPKLHTDDLVLAPDYVVVDGIIINKSNYRIVRDALVESLDLSVRSLHCLKRNSNTTISSLIGMLYDDFRKIWNLGVKSACEVEEKLNVYLSKNQEEFIHPPDPSQFVSRNPGYSSENDIKEKWDKNPDTNQEALSLQDISNRKVSASAILSCFRDHEFESKSFLDIKQTLPYADDNNLLDALKNLVDSKTVTFKDGYYSIYRPSYFEFIQSLDNPSGLKDRAIRILKMRATGYTLEEIGKLEGTTRERIRQIEMKAFDKVTKRGTKLYDEDKYAYVYCTYSLEKEFFCDYLGESSDIWFYLNFRYSRGKSDPFEALEDKSIATNVRRAIDKYVHRGFVQIDGVYIPVQRGAIEDYVVENFCKDEVNVDEFFDLYNQFLIDNELMSENLEVNESVRYTRTNRLAESLKLLWKQNQRLRYYDIEGTDYTELFETLNLGQYHNIELSTRKLLLDYPELMRRYDLRDEYEIHNLLKKIHAEKENSEMDFRRMPSIQFGTFDRDLAVIEILFALAPVSVDDLAEMISLEYGVQVATIKANWLNCIKEYYHQGKYSVDYEAMPEEQIARLNEELTDDFYFLSEIRKIYEKLIPDADLSLITPYNLKKMGFLVGGSYVIQYYPTAEAYFDNLLTSSDLIDLVPIRGRFTGLTTYSTLLARLKHEMKIIEFEPYQCINIRRLEKLGFNRERLKQYGDRVWSFLVNDDYFTIQSLRVSGFEDELESLGFGDMFYSSILKEDERFTWQRVGSNVVFNPKGNQFSVHDFLVDRVTKEKAIDVDDFVNILLENYGVSLEKSDIISKIKGSDVYYDSIMGKLYADYMMYFEEI